MGAYVSEGRDGVAWVDLEGRKLGGKTWVGGNWTGAPFMAFDSGSKAVGANSIYVGSVFETGKGTGNAELRLTALTAGADKPVLKWEFDAAGLMRRREASINDVPIQPADRKFHWPLGRRPDDHPGLSELGL